jgi:hypothetical protein
MVCQPPCQLASSLAEPFALAPANTPDSPGRPCTQRCTVSASSMLALMSPPPDVCAMRPSTCALPPGSTRLSLPLAACSATRTCSLPSTLARWASMRSVRRSSTWSFHWPWATARSSAKPGRALLPAPPSARSAASKVMVLSTCSALSVPLTGAPDSSVYSAPGRTPRTVAWACQGEGAGLHLPAASMRPPPARTVASGKLQWVPSKPTWACTCSTGSFCSSHGPGRALRMSADAFHAAGPVSASGCSSTLPVSCVCGAPGHRLDASTLRRSALASITGCGSQGAICACTLASMGASAFSSAGFSSAATCSRAPAPASVPLTVAAASTSMWWSSASGAFTRPSSAASIAMGAGPCSFTRAL